MDLAPVLPGDCCSGLGIAGAELAAGQRPR